MRKQLFRLTISSAASFTAVTDNTNTRGTIEDAGFKGEMPGINCTKVR